MLKQEMVRINIGKKKLRLSASRHFIFYQQIFISENLLRTFLKLGVIMYLGKIILGKNHQHDQSPHSN